MHPVVLLAKLHKVLRTSARSPGQITLVLCSESSHDSNRKARSPAAIAATGRRMNTAACGSEPRSSHSSERRRRRRRRLLLCRQLRAVVVRLWPALACSTRVSTRATKTWTAKDAPVECAFRLPFTVRLSPLPHCQASSCSAGGAALRRLREERSSASCGAAGEREVAARMRLMFRLRLKRFETDRW